VSPPDGADVTPFLRARWRHVAMLNFETDRSVLAELVPPGTELDEWEGRTCLSVVGFLFLDTRLLGLPIPFHRDFEEVNLRFYVRRRADGGWRRGVVFVREIVPRAAVAFVARALYGERYLALPMDHVLTLAADKPPRIASASYGWTLRGRPHRLSVWVDGRPAPPAPGSHEQFIAEHHWGYCARRDGATTEYRVDHPPWGLVAASRAELDGDLAALYGERLAEPLRGRPVSAFLADGSEVTVSLGSRLEA